MCPDRWVLWRYRLGIFSQGIKIGEWIRENEKVYSKQWGYFQKVKKEKDLRGLDRQEGEEDGRLKEKKNVSQEYSIQQMQNQI